MNQEFIHGETKEWLLPFLNMSRGGKVPSALVKVLKKNPKKSYRITIAPENELADEEMPVENKISKKLIASVKRSEKSLKAGKFTTLSTKDKRTAHFKKLWNG